MSEIPLTVCQMALVPFVFTYKFLRLAIMITIHGEEWFEDYCRDNPLD